MSAKEPESWPWLCRYAGATDSEWTEIPRGRGEGMAITPSKAAMEFVRLSLRSCQDGDRDEVEVHRHGLFVVVARVELTVEAK